MSPLATPSGRRGAAVVVVCATLLAGCGSSSSGDPEAEPTVTPTTAETTTRPDESPTPTESPSPTEPTETGSATAEGSPTRTPTTSATQRPAADETIAIVVRGDAVAPNGKRVDLEVGGRLRLEIDANRAGELHVHSTPEQVLAFGEGEVIRDLVLDAPGIVEVEEHESGLVLLRVYVS